MGVRVVSLCVFWPRLNGVGKLRQNRKHGRREAWISLLDTCSKMLVGLWGQAISESPSHGPCHVREGPDLPHRGTSTITFLQGLGRSGGGCSLVEAVG